MALIYLILLNLSKSVGEVLRYCSWNSD